MIGKAFTPGTARSLGCSSAAISPALRSRSAQSPKPTKEMPCDTVGLPAITR